MKIINKFKSKKDYNTIFSLVFLIFIITSFLLKVYPFGDNTFLWTDSDQYLAVDSYFSTLLGKNNIFYSWGNVLGGNALSLFAYYCFSPLSILFFLFKSNVVLGSHILLFIKIELCALSFCYCLRYISKKDFWIRIILSLSYAYMGYVVFYAWNISWLDGVLLLPLMYVGLNKFLKGGKPYLYVFSLAIAIISNFYIGYMLGIASVLFYCIYVLIESDNLLDTIKRTLGKYILFTGIAVGMSCCILIPTYLALPESRSVSLMQMFKEMHLNCKPSEILSSLFSGQKNELNTNSPLVYCGILPFMLAILFFLNEKINIKRKFVYGLLIFIFFLSFSNSFINIIWHGFSDNAWFNYRYSFIFTFILLIISYESYFSSKKILNKKEITNILSKLVLVFLIGIIFVLENANGKNNYILLMMDVFIFILIFIQFYNKKRINNLIVLLSICAIVLNNYSYLHTYVQSNYSSYQNQKENIDSIKKVINDESFYRMDKDYITSRCDALLCDYNGVTNYASTENLNALNTSKRLGMNQTWMWAKYTSNAPYSSETLLGLKYIISKNSNNKPYKKIGINNGEVIYKNNNAFPIIFSVKSFYDISYDKLNDFEYQNKIWRSMNDIGENVFKKNDVIVSNDNDEKKIDISVLSSGAVYVYFPSSEINSIINVTNNKNGNIKYDRYESIYYVGEYKRGDIVSLEIDAEKDINKDLIVSYSEQKEIVRKNAKLINSQNINIKEVSSSHLEVEYKGDSNKIATTIPYDQGWSVYDNGKKIETRSNWNSFLYFELDNKKEHKIKMIYYPKGFKLGVAVSSVSIILLLGYVVYDKRLFQKSKFREINNG